MTFSALFDVWTASFMEVGETSSEPAADAEGRKEASPVSPGSSGGVCMSAWRMGCKGIEVRVRGSDLAEPSPPIVARREGELGGEGGVCDVTASFWNACGRCLKRVGLSDVRAWGVIPKQMTAYLVAMLWKI